jgi:hypothetical protein
MTPLRLTVCAVAIAGLTLSCRDSSAPPTPVGPEPTKSALLPVSSMTAGCYNWPDEEFSPTNHAMMGVLGAFGDPAVDFSLRDIHGTMYHLSSLLETRPVFLIFGAFT